MSNRYFFLCYLFFILIHETEENIGFVQCLSLLKLETVVGFDIVDIYLPPLGHGKPGKPLPSTALEPEPQRNLKIG